MKKDCTMDEVMEKLKAPFSSKDIEWRVSRSGVSNNGKGWAMVLAYVTNRAIQNRLDTVFGPGGWKNSFKEFMQGIICEISCYIDGEWVSKEDGAEQTQFESLKGGLSQAMKRCGSQWGIGRYLYSLEEQYVEVFNEKKQGAIYLNDKKNNLKGYWFPPQLPDWALPEDEKTGNSSSSNNQRNQGAATSQKRQVNNQQGQQTKNTSQDNNKGFNREAAVKAITEFLTNTGFKEHPGWVMPLFKRINPQIKQATPNEVFAQATENELKRYYDTLRPVNDLVLISNHYKVSLDEALNYVQILLPQIQINDIFSCFMHLSIEHVKEVSEMIKGGLKNGDIKQIA